MPRFLVHEPTSWRAIQESESPDHRHRCQASQSSATPKHEYFRGSGGRPIRNAHVRIATPSRRLQAIRCTFASEGRLEHMVLDDILVILLAAGAGERLYPLTKERAKPAVYFGSPYRIIDFTLSNCINSGLRRIFIATQYKSLSLNRHIRMGWGIVSEELGEFVKILPPQKRVGENWYLGTADAVFQNLYSVVRENPRQVIVLGSDHVYKMDYAKMLRFHRECR